MAYEDATSAFLTGVLDSEPEYFEDAFGNELCEFTVCYTFRRFDAEGPHMETGFMTCIYHRPNDWFRATVRPKARVAVQGRLMQEGHQTVLDLSYFKLI